MHVFNPESRYNTDAIGTKGEGLLQMCSRFNVPEWFAVPWTVFDNLLNESGTEQLIREKLKRLTPENTKQIAEEIGALIRAIKPGEELKAEMSAGLERIVAADGYVAVRSSSGDEDGIEHSFAGIHQSSLFVRGIEDLCACLLKVWASAYSEKALRYRCAERLRLHPVRMGVVVQKMIDAKTSGIIRTADPVTEDYASVVISAIYGLGTGLGVEALEPDRYTFNREDRKITTVAGTKNRRFGVNRVTNRGVYEYPVDEDVRILPALSSVQVEKLVDVALAIEKHYGRPQEIEFCFDENGALYILQVRNIIALREYGPAAGNCRVWDNTLVADSFSGVTSPMTFSYLRDAFVNGCRSFCDIVCISRFRIAADREICREVPGLFKGRIYLSVTAVRELLRQIPGYACCRNQIESLTGIRGREYGCCEEGEKISSVRRILAYPGALMLGTAVLGRCMTLWMRVPVFKRRIKRFIRKNDVADFKGMQPHELMQLYERLESGILRRWKTPLLSLLYKRLFHRLLGYCCARWCEDENGKLRDDLLCGESGTVRRPAGVLMKLAQKIKGFDAAKYVFQTCSPEELALIIPSYPDFQEICQDIQQYLDAYGLRCANELKLEKPSLRENPEQLYGIIKNYIDMNDARLDVNAISVREKILRAEAEQRLFRTLSGMRRFLLHVVLRHARKGIRYDDEIRYARVRLTSFVRSIFNAMGERMAREGIIENDQDIYFLTTRELREYIYGSSATTDLRSLIAIRHEEYASYFNDPAEMSEHFLTYGMAYNHNAFVNKSAAPKKEKKSDAVQDGFPGEKAHVFDSAVRDKRWSRDILISAKSDLKWVIPHGIGHA